MRVLDAASKGWRASDLYMVRDEEGRPVVSAEYLWDENVRILPTMAANFAIIVHAREMLELIEALWYLYHKETGIAAAHYERIVDMVRKVENTYKELTGE